MTLGTLVTSLVLILCVALVIRHMVRSRKNGTGCGCGGNCSGCSACASATGQGCSCTPGKKTKL